MSKPEIHATSSVKKFGGKMEDYLPIHQIMDSSKSLMADNRHRALTHNCWFIGADGPLEWKFGTHIVNSDGKKISVRDIGEQHILEDFRGQFIPTVSDYFEEMEYRPWMSADRRDHPSSFKKIAQRRKNNKLAIEADSKTMVD